ncbi:hypothetical protein RUM8411_00902 [Ruegeria meonggei]|uniref:Uncharacterized protein n=1 Tax=Ruegeria meonggei TaxID=1446476 RepID=A0A1X6YK06_9RHOB|nr:hypothetical protein RUM8411_00902 [Ruegeria meonggei]
MTVSSDPLQIGTISNTARPLVEFPINRQIGQCAKQQRAYVTVSDKQNVTFAGIGQVGRNGLDDTRLCNHGPFPASYTDFQMTEELVRDGLKLFWRQ